MKIVDKLMKMLEEHSKSRTRALLNRLPEEQLRDMGISPELLAVGVKAWPWQEMSDDDLTPISLRKVRLSNVKVEDVKRAASVTAENAVEPEVQKTAA